jgi:hypothetical protein
MIKVDIKVKGDKHLRIDGVNADKVSLVKQRYETEHIVDTGTSRISSYLDRVKPPKNVVNLELCCSISLSIVN